MIACQTWGACELPELPFCLWHFCKPATGAGSVLARVLKAHLLQAVRCSRSAGD